MNTKFFGNVQARLARDYTLIIDKSGSMAGSLWKQARQAVSLLAPFVCKADPDGITIYFFSSPGVHPRINQITSAQQVESLFNRYSPGGSTDLGGVLKQALNDYFKKSTDRPETILVITDGQPNDQELVKQVIVDATKKLSSDNQLSISFIQIGNDRAAHKFLKQLDNDLKGAKFDIVDEVTTDEMKDMSFVELIQKSIED